MHPYLLPLTLVACAASVSAAGVLDLTDVCTSSYAAAALPVDVSDGIIIDVDSVSASASLGYSVSASDNQPDATFDYCNVTFTYSHTDRNDTISVTFWLPAPQDFQNRYLSSGGGGEAINSGASGLAMGIPYGAVTGLTGGGLGSGDNFYDVFLLTNGSINWEEMFMFAYQAHHELALIGKAFTRLFFDMEDSTRLYSYYQACSEGGREGMSQVQRFGGQFDGSIIGAPAMRYAFQQVQHLWSDVVENTLDHYPSPCVFEYIVNQTIITCDPLDGKTDGVVSRTDLCILDYDISVLVGKSYYCAATAATMGGTATPAASGTISKLDIKVAQTILSGMHDNEGRRVYFSYQPSAAFSDASTTYNATSGEYVASVDGIGGEWVAQALLEQEISTLANLDNVTYDTLKEWVNLGLNKYYSSLHTAWPDLTPYKSGGGKILHYHGESDYSVPTASSVRFFESVRSIMYPDLDMRAGATALSEWYRLFLVPGGSHCAPNTAEPNGPWPQTNLAVMIEWVEKNIAPATLNATVLQGANIGQNQQICAWPTRPLWINDGKTMECVFDQRGYETWVYSLNAILMPVY